MNSEDKRSSEDKSQDTKERQGDSNAPETDERKRISRIADEIAQRGKKRQIHNEKGRNIFTK